MDQSMLDMFYAAYTEKHPIENQAMREAFRGLDRYLALLPKEDQNCLFQLICNIYTENERLAFTAGVQAGARLAMELAE